MRIKRWTILAGVIGATLLLGSLESSISAEEIDFFKLREETETQDGKLNIPTMRTKQFKVELFWITESFLNTKRAEELIFSRSKLFYCMGFDRLLNQLWDKEIEREEMSPDSFTELLRSGYLILYVRYTNTSMEDAKWDWGWPTDSLDIVDDEGNQYNSAKEDIFDLAPADIIHPTAIGVMIKFYRNKKNEPPKYTTIYYCFMGEGTEAFIKIPYQWEDLMEWHNFTKASPVSPITDEKNA